MGKKIEIPVVVRCADCNECYVPSDRFPLTKFEVEGMMHLSEDDRTDIFKNLAIAMSSFNEYVFLKYQLDAKKIEVDAEFVAFDSDKLPEA